MKHTTTALIAVAAFVVAAGGAQAKLPELLAAQVPPSGSLKGRGVWGWSDGGAAEPSPLLDENEAWPDRVAYDQTSGGANSTFFWAYSQWVYATDLATHTTTLIVQLPESVLCLCSGYGLVVAASKTKVVAFRGGKQVLSIANPITDVAFIYLREFCTVTSENTFALTADGWHWQGARKTNILQSQVLVYNINNGLSKLYPLPDERVCGIASGPGAVVFTTNNWLYTANDWETLSFASPSILLSINGADSVAVVPSTSTIYATASDGKNSALNIIDFSTSKLVLHNVSWPAPNAWRIAATRF